MAPLQGMSGLLRDPVDTTQTMDEGVLEAKANPTDPEHGVYGSSAYGYGGTVPTEPPYGPFPSYDGWAFNPDYTEMDYKDTGLADDQTAQSHIAAWPRGIIQPDWDNADAYALVGEQVEILHGRDMGGVKFQMFNSPGGHEEETHYTTDNYVAPNDNYLAPEIPGQVRGSGGYGGGRGGVGNAGGSNADPTQGYGVLNTYEEFNAGHSIRRVQHDHMPWDYTNTHGEQDVPFFARHPVGQMPLDGPDSPYFEQGSNTNLQVPWEGRIGDPTAYQQPAEVTVTAPQPSSDNYPSYAF